MRIPPRLRMPSVFVALVLLLAACGGTTGSTWTIAPLHATPSAAPSAVPSAGPSGGPSQPAGSPGQSAARGQTIQLALTNTLQITRDGAQVTELEVHEGETVHFVIENTAGFEHDFFIGSADDLSQGTTDGLPGVEPFSSGTQEFDYAVTADTDGLQFACTIPGHYQSMHGTFKVVP